MAFNCNIPIYGVKTKGLKEFETTEKDLQNYVRRMPPEDFRITHEDLLQLPWPELRPDLEAELKNHPRMRDAVRELVGRLKAEVDELKADCL